MNGSFYCSQPARGPQWGSNVSCFLFLSRKVWAIRVYLPSPVTGEVLQYIKFNFPVCFQWWVHWTMFATTSLLKILCWQAAYTSNLGTLGQLEKTECSVFPSKYYYRQCFLTSYWIGFYFLTSYSSLRVCFHSVQFTFTSLLFLTLFSFISWLQYLSIRALPGVQPETVEYSRALERERERESHPGTGGWGGIRWEGGSSELTQRVK